MPMRCRGPFRCAKAVERGAAHVGGRTSRRSGPVHSAETSLRRLYVDVRGSRWGVGRASASAVIYSLHCVIR
eukprot:7377138-Prymnesium_polylepis.1